MIQSDQYKSVIRISTPDWLKICGVLVLHTALLVWGVSSIVNRLDQRITRVETTQRLMLDHIIKDSTDK